MEERLAIHRSGGMNRNTLRLWGLILMALGLLSRGILQTRVLGIGSGSTEQLMQTLELSGGMTAAATALALEAVESCAVPIFAVLLIDGFNRTKRFRNYFLRVLAVAVVSEIPYNIAVSAALWDPSSRNPVFALVLSMIALYLYQYYQGLEPMKLLIKTAVFAAAVLWSVMLRVKFGVTMLVVVTVLWGFRGRKTLRNFLGAAAAICCCVGNPLYMFSPFGFLLAHFYNGEEGASVPKLQYALYPLLLVLVGAVGSLLF